MYAIRFPNGDIDQTYVGATQREVWFERGFWMMCQKYGGKWKSEFWKREKASIKDFKEKGYEFVKVEVVEDFSGKWSKHKDAQSLKRCLPCKKCGIKPVWGAGFLVCEKCGEESEMNDKGGKAVRSWNKVNKEI